MNIPRDRASLRPSPRSRDTDVAPDWLRRFVQRPPRSIVTWNEVYSGEGGTTAVPPFPRTAEGPRPAAQSAKRSRSRHFQRHRCGRTRSCGAVLIRRSRAARERARAREFTKRGELPRENLPTKTREKEENVRSGQHFSRRRSADANRRKHTLSATNVAFPVARPHGRLARRCSSARWPTAVRDP